MARTRITAGLLTTAAMVSAALVVPVIASAAPSGKDRSNAARECRAERSAMGVENFRNKYGTNRNRRNAFGKCVSQKAKQNKEAADERDRRQLNAARACRAEQRLDPAAFALKYGNRRNAFGRCVSQHARQGGGV